MALRIARAVDSRLFGGFHLEPTDLKSTSDDIIWIRKINISPEHKYAVFNVRSGDHTREFVLDVQESFSLGKDVTLWLEDCDEYPMVVPTKCYSCGAQRKETRKVFFAQARIGVSAPREYKLIRDDARKR